MLLKLRDAAVCESCLDDAKEKERVHREQYKTDVPDEKRDRYSLPLPAVRCAVCGVRCAVCGVRCAVCAVRCALCAVIF